MKLKSVPTNYLNKSVTEKRFINDKVGHGMFATQYIHEGSVIMEYSQEVVLDQNKALNDEYKDYYFIFNGKAIRPTDITAPGPHLINHRCKPNCSFFDTDNGVYVVSTKPILKGEELTIYYGWLRRVAPPCYCSTSGCPGTIGYKTDNNRTQEQGFELFKHAVHVLNNVEAAMIVKQAFRLDMQFCHNRTYETYQSQIDRLIKLRDKALRLI